MSDVETHAEPSAVGQITALLSGERRRIDFEKCHLRPDGEVVTARVTSEGTILHGEPVFFTQVHDATDEVAALATMCAAEQRFRPDSIAMGEDEDER